MSKPDHLLADPEAFRSLVRGSPVDLYTLRSGAFVTQITNFGGRIVNMVVPDRHGRVGRVVLGFDALDAYLTATDRFYGAIIGRYGNRIAHGRFVLDGCVIELATNDGAHHIHGGNVGFDSVVWDAVQKDDRTLVLTYSSDDMEEGYPGSLKVKVTYSVTDDPGLNIAYEATTDAPTVVNLTNHAHFNLAGAGSGPVLDHVLNIEADHFTPIDAGFIPTGKIASVEGTPLDFRRPTRIGARIDAGHDQLRHGLGYDHNFVLRSPGTGVRLAASLNDPSSGRFLEVFTDTPGMQLYCGNFFDGSDIGASGQPHRYRESIALETQYFPDSPNQPGFPSVILRPGERYASTTRYVFGCS